MIFLGGLFFMALAYLGGLIGINDMWTNYMYLDIGWGIIQVVAVILIISFIGAITEEQTIFGVINAGIIFVVVVTVGSALILALIASKIFSIPFAMGYCIVDLIIRLYQTYKKSQ